MRIDKDIYFMEVARTVAKRSTCVRRSVGCVLVNGQSHIVATGFNGVPRGMPHCNEERKAEPYRVGNVHGEECWSYPNACPGGADAASGTSLESCSAIHAEQNALLQCPDVSMVWSAYCTTYPCLACQKLLLNTGIVKLCYDATYPFDLDNPVASYFLERVEVVCVQLEGKFK